MARLSGRAAAAARRRRKHEQRITEQANPLDQLGAAWSWLYAEARHTPHLISDAIRRLCGIAADLNADQIGPEKGDPRCP